MTTAASTRRRSVPWLWGSVAASLVVAVPGVLIGAGVTELGWIAASSMAAAVASVFVKIGTDRLGR